MGQDPQFWARAAEFYAYNIIPALAWNYIKLPLAERKDLQVPLRTCLLLPTYKVVSSSMAFLGTMRALLIYLPNFTGKPTISEIEERETKNQEQLERELAAEPKDGPLTFKRILYSARFFRSEPSVVLRVEPLAESNNQPSQACRATL